MKIRDDFYKKETSHLFIAFLLFLVTFVTFLNSINNQFINIDDYRYVVHNPLIREIDVTSLKRIFSHFWFSDYLPLNLISFSIDYHFWQLNPKGYHITNIILHIINVILVYLFFFVLTKNKRVSIFTALFFGLHPVQVESVAWISERKTLLFFFFGFLSLITYLKGKKPFYIFSLFFFLCSLLSKSHAVIIPFLLVLIDIFQDKIERKKILEKIPYFIFTIIFSIITILSQARVGGIKEPFGGSFTSHLFTMAKAFLLYFRNIFFPFYLNNYYNIHPVTNFFSISAIFSLIFIILILFITILSFKRNKKIFFSLSWFFIALLPVSNIIPISIVMADRYLYLPIIGIAFLLANLLFNQEKEKISLFIYIFVSVIIVTLIGLTVQRNKVWHDSISLWQDSLKKDNKNSKAWDMLGVAFYNKKEY
ncbi:MAG: hypothetical protein DRG20_01185, partial [Deltaproteobacteria bacterium]